MPRSARRGRAVAGTRPPAASVFKARRPTLPSSGKCDGSPVPVSPMAATRYDWRRVPARRRPRIRRFRFVRTLVGCTPITACTSGCRPASSTARRLLSTDVPMVTIRARSPRRVPAGARRRSPPRNPHNRGGRACRRASRKQARDDVDAQSEDRQIEDERNQPVSQRQPAQPLRTDLHVGDLAGHADDE